MLISYTRGQGSVILRVKIRNSSVSTGAGLAGLTSASAGLKIATIADNEATSTTYTSAGSTIETITTLGTYAAPTATKCRFKEVGSDHPGVYEIQLADARLAVASCKSLMVSISGATNAAECDVLIPLMEIDPYDNVRLGITALPNAAAEALGGLYTRGTGAGQINQPANGLVDVNVENWNTTAVPAEHTAGYPIVTIKDGTGTGEINTNLGAIAVVDLVTTTTTLTNLPAITANWLTAAGTAADFGTEVGTAVWATAARTLTAATNITDTGGTLNIDASGNVFLADGAHGGTAATLTAERIIVASTTLNEPAFKMTGNGTGPGIRSTGGTSGDGVQFMGGATTGAGLYASANGGNEDGVHFQGQGTGRGIHAVGGNAGDGAFIAGLGAGFGLHIIGGATNAPGLYIEAQGTGSAIEVQGSTGTGIEVVGPVTMSSTLAVAGATTLTGAVSLGSTLTVTGATTFTGAVGLSSTLTVTGAATFSDTTNGTLGAIIADIEDGGRTDLLIDALIALLDAARTEPGQGAPPVNPDAVTKIDYLYKAWRNKATQTATEYKLYADDATTVDQKATVSDDATTFTRGEVATGP